ncbi:hypothetical protein KUCAC02_027906 [Chaenocephalus aceratus]|uniref:Uncharacterized protein n=1 Tax=Chaenocephalus aceratus TaxID=36190 RepID=A0ACB9X2B4_CHAAC|nr:hypothetical protein KUCAC02_027906 [Chaenocephalus aceratus]
MEHPVFRRAPNGTLFLKATAEASTLAPRRAAGQAPYRAKKPEEVDEEAWAHVSSEGGSTANATLVLSRWKVQFGQYQGKIFHWLLENDVGYAINLVASHQKERERTGSQSPLMANKDAFTRYSSAYPDFLEAVRFHRAERGLHQSACIILKPSEFDVPGWLSEDTLVFFMLCILDVVLSHRPLGSAFAAFVSGRRSLSAVEMQADKKLVPKPAFLGKCSPNEMHSLTLFVFLMFTVYVLLTHVAITASLRSALPSKPSEEPSDEELIRAKDLTWQPTDEELLEATLEQDHALRPPAVVQPAPAPSSLPPPAATASPGAAAPGQEELAGPAFPPPPRELLPVSWRAALTVEQQQWIGRVLFTRDQWGRPSLIPDLNLWWNPPQTRPIYHQPPASPDPFFACRLFLWMPHRIWRLQLTCPQPSCTGSMVKAGLYRTIRRVLDIDGWYLMATEYLECRRCKKKVGGWSQGIIRQLAPTYSCQFPAVLTYKLSCDHRVVTQLKSRTLGNSATQLCNTLREQHSDAWMRRAIQYLGVCEQFLALCNVRGPFPPPPIMPTLPSPIWLLTVYGYDILTRLDEYKARITSTFGSILKMDSTKKVSTKLAGAASDTAAWVTNVGNEYGQVLISVLTCSEGLSSMAAGLMRRYRLAGVPPPQLIYVDRDCCRRDGVSKTAALFQEWGQLVVRLDIWHLMRRFAAGVTTESHELYPAFMRQLSLCIFEVDSGDARRLIEAKRSQLEGKHGMVGLTDAEVIRRITREEWRLHCRRRTRGAEETALLIQDLLQTFGGTAGRDTLDIPLLDPLRIQDIWSTQRPHLSCIQDPPGVQLYTQTGRLTKGGVILPVYRCARGSTSLESFHLHLNRFIPGTQASAKHFQAFLIDGLVRWNEDRAAAASGEVEPLRSYSGHLKHVLNQKSQRDFTKPAEYTGELIGVEFLYRQTGKVLEDVSLDPDIPDEAAAIQSLEEVDEGIEEDVEDPTVFQPDIPSTSAAARSGDPADAPRSEPSGPAAPHQPDPPEAPEAPAQQSSSDSEMQGPDGQPGYQHVLKLAKALLEARSLQGFSDKRVDDLMALWQRLPEPDRRRVVYPPRHRERQPKGRFKAAKGKNTSCPGKESLQRCLLGLHSGPATWPSTSRLVEAI